MRPGLSCRLQYLHHLIVVEPGDDRGEGDGGSDTGVGERFNREEAFCNGWGLRLNVARHFVIGERHADVYRQRCNVGQLTKHIHVSEDERRLRNDGDRISEFGTHLQAGTSQTPGCLQRLIAIRVPGKHDHFPFP